MIFRALDPARSFGLGGLDVGEKELWTEAANGTEVGDRRRTLLTYRETLSVSGQPGTSYRAASLLTVNINAWPLMPSGDFTLRLAIR